MRQYTYELNEHQIKIQNEVSQLPTDNLHYIVVQQKIRRKIFTDNELKNHIQRSIKKYVRRKDPVNYYDGKENETIKYIAFFETTEDFFKSQHTNKIVDTNFYAGLHFHLFIAGVNDDYINELICQLSSQKNKQGCISKIDWVKKEKLDYDFILYHTKQMMYRYSPKMVLKNLK